MLSVYLLIFTWVIKFHAPGDPITLCQMMIRVYIITSETQGV